MRFRIVEMKRPNGRLNLLAVDSIINREGYDLSKEMSMDFNLSKYPNGTAALVRFCGLGLYFVKKNGIWVNEDEEEIK